MSKLKNYIMKTLKTLLMIALFSVVTISCTDLTAEDEIMQHPPVEHLLTSGDPATNMPPTDDNGSGTGTGTDTGTGDGSLDTGNGEDGTDNGSGKGN